MYDLTIIGAGPAGMMAALSAAENNPKLAILLLERNKVLGKKLLLTGKGRCNLTTTKEVPEIVDRFGKKGKFLYSALSKFSNMDLINFFEFRGVKTKIERGSRVYPKNDQAFSILNCLQKELIKHKIKILYDFRVVKISSDQGCFTILQDRLQKAITKKVILATGGKSYPETGSTGDGYLIARSLGHLIIPLHPGLAPLFIQNKTIRMLAGLSLKNIKLSILGNDHLLGSFQGDLLFTHQGISGPVVFKTTKIVSLALKQGKKVTAKIDLKPALTTSQLKQRIYHDIHLLPKKEYLSLLKLLLPRIFIPLIIKKTNISPHKKNGLLTHNEVLRLIECLKNFSFAIDAVAPLKDAIVTSGGVAVAEIDSRTMESKKVPNLYFAGEIIALDGPTGGFNLQKAFSTGWLAGFSASTRSSMSFRAKPRNLSLSQRSLDYARDDGRITK